MTMGVEVDEFHIILILVLNVIMGNLEIVWTSCDILFFHDD